MSGRSSEPSLDEVLSEPPARHAPMQNGNLNERVEKRVRGLRGTQYLQDGAGSSLQSDNASPVANDRAGDESNHNSSSSWRTAESDTKHLPVSAGAADSSVEQVLLRQPFHQRLHLLGFLLSPEKEATYFELLQSFFRAQITKAEFQDALHELFSLEELHEHNMLMRDLQSRTLHGADADLPALPDILELARSSRHRRQNLLQLKPFSSKEAEQLVRADLDAVGVARRPNKRRRGGVAATMDVTAVAGDGIDTLSRSAATPGTRRKVGGTRLSTRASAAAERRSRHQRRDGRAAAAMLPGDSDGAKAVSTTSYRDEAIFQQATADLRQRELIRRSERLDTPAATNAMTTAMDRQRIASLRRSMLAGATTAGYSALPFTPLPPGMGMDLEIFLKLKRRLVQLLEAVEQMSASSTGNEIWVGYESLPFGFSSTAKASSRGTVTGIRDEAVALLVHSIEMQVRDLLDAIYGIPDYRVDRARFLSAPHRRLPV